MMRVFLSLVCTFLAGTLVMSANGQVPACAGQAVTFRLPANIMGSIQWQDSTVGGNWSNITGATADSLNHTANSSRFFRALISEPGCTNESGTIQLLVNQPPTAANAGSNLTNASNPITLAANTPAIGTGLWTIVAGTGGVLASPSLPNSSFTGAPGVTYTLEWSISNLPCQTSRDTITIVMESGPALPSITCLGQTLFVHPTDNAGPTPWGCVGTVTNASSNTNGALNTATIATANCTGTPAANICNNLTAFGFSDWYLPAYDQLLCLRDNATTIGGFQSGGYWSSTENATFNANAMMRTFPSGVSGVSSKSNSHRIRCVRH